MANATEDLLRAILSVAGRQAFRPNDLAKIVNPKAGKANKQARAFNMCDGTRTQADVVKQLKLDPGNFSRTVGRWLAAGVMFRLGEGREATLLHVYPLRSDDEEPEP